MKDMPLVPGSTITEMGRLLFGRCRYLTESAFSVHMPFVSWLLGVLNPACVVQLGIDDGMAYFSICQGLETMNGGGRCFGFEPDNTTAGYARILDYNEREYPTFSRIFHAPIATSGKTFSEGPVNLLFVNLPLDAALFNELCSHWLPKMEARGFVILLPGTSDQIAHKGGADLLAEPATRVLESPFAGGLTAVLRGSKLPPTLVDLAELTTSSRAHSDMHRMFARLGDLYRFEQDQRAKAAQHAEVDRLRTEGHRVAKEAAELRAELQLRDHKLALAQSLAFRLTAEQDQMRGELDVERKRIAAAAETLELAQQGYRAELSAMGEQMIEQVRKSQALAAELNVERQRIATAAAALELVQQGHRAELSAMDRLMIEQVRKSQALAVELDVERQRIAAATEALELVQQGHRAELSAMSEQMRKSQALAAELPTLERICRAERLAREDAVKFRKQYEAISTSTSWKITLPLRRLVMLFRRAPRN